MSIHIRKLSYRDIPGIAEMRKEGFSRKNWLYTGGNKAWTKKEISARMKMLKERKELSFGFVAIDTKTKQIVGSTNGSYRKNGRIRHYIDIGWGVHPDYQGRGIGTMLLKRLLSEAKRKGFKRAEAEMAVENKSSWKLALKCGFKIEGRKRKALLTDDGRYINTYVVGKLL